MRRQVIHTIAIVLMWVGGLEICADFLAKYLFAFQLSLTPVFFIMLLAGIVLYLLMRFV